MPDNDPASRYGDLVVVVVLLVAAVIGLGVVLALVRRWMRRTRDDSAHGPASVWTLQDLRELRDSGEISVPEYERLRAAILGQASDGASRPSRPEAAGPKAKSDSNGFLTAFGKSDDNDE